MEEIYYIWDKEMNNNVLILADEVNNVICIWTGGIPENDNGHKLYISIFDQLWSCELSDLEYLCMKNILSKVKFNKSAQ